MQGRNILKKLREQRTVLWAGTIISVIIVFSLGVAVGEGRLRFTRPAGYSNQTGLPNSINYATVNQLYDALRENYNGKLTEQQLLEGLKHGLAEATEDPYTQYFTPKEAKAFNTDLQGISLTGVGAQLDEDAEGNIVVIAPLNGSPAAAAGVEAKDIITSIDNQSTAGMSVNTVVAKIRGKKGSKVTIGVQRGSQQLVFTITRDTITVPTASGKMLDNGIGYLQISQFSSDTYSLLRKAITTLKQQGATKFVLDLRDNPGGEVDSAQSIASLWLENNTLIMEEKRGSQVIDSLRAQGSSELQGTPTVVLINAGSASASEITALALRDNGVATIIGQKSYGKGVVQSVLPFSDGSELKVTIAKWYSPKGTSINKKGISPDQTVTQSEADTTNHIDTQLEAAKAYLTTK